MNKLKVAIVGASGYVGQRFATLMSEHPWFEIKELVASERSAGRTYQEVMEGRWKLDIPMPSDLKQMVVKNSSDIHAYADEVDLVFCAVDMKKSEIVKLEEAIAKTETPLISNNSANRWGSDIPMMIPEINYEHAALIEAQRERLGTERGFIACKPNCSIQSYVPALTPLLKYMPEKLFVSTYQAISGAGKTFRDWPEMKNNLIPFIGGEEEKSEKEPLKIWGKLCGNKVENAALPVISAQCYRVAVQEGHTASVAVKFRNKPSIAEIIECWENFETMPQKLQLPSAPKPFLKYFDEDNRPQPAIDAELGGGMTVSIGRLREDPIFDYKFCCLSHNTLRGAAGGAVETAELLVKLGYIEKK